MKTEMEKCLAGEWYDCHNQVFLDLKTRTHKLLMKYNSLPYEDKEEKHSLLKKMLGSIGMKVSVASPFICDYGCNTVPYYNVTPENIQRLAYITEEMETESRNINTFAHKDYLKYLVKMFLIYIQRIGQRGTGIPLCINNSSNRTFVQFRQTLEHHYRHIHTVKEYANYLNVSTKTLTNCVYESSHSTPLKIINDRVILEAKRQLLHSSLKIKEIAFYLGFEDPSYFVKFFKRQTGYLPAEFRE